MNITYTLDTEAIVANTKVNAANAGLAIVQTQVATKLVREKLREEQNRIVKQFGLNEGLKLDVTNACGKGTKWAKARAQLSREVETQAKGKGIGFTNRLSCDRAANRALNAERNIIQWTMEHKAIRDKSGRITDVNLEDVESYFGEGSDGAKAAEAHYDYLCKKKFGLEVTAE